MKLLKKRYDVYKQNCIEANERLRAIEAQIALKYYPLKSGVKSNETTNSNYSNRVINKLFCFVASLR